jgi:hypothetical protein
MRGSRDVMFKIAPWLELLLLAVAVGSTVAAGSTVAVGSREVIFKTPLGWSICCRPSL